MPRNNSNTVSNRSEIVCLWSASDCNPNGDPKSGNNRPRIDPETQQAVVTDVRVKRYLRDQLAEDGHGVYIRDERFNGQQATREQLLQDRLDKLNPNEYDDDELEDAIFADFLDQSSDIRYFGATLGVDTDDDRINNALPSSFTGPVQFSIGRSLHPVQLNEESNSLTSVIATKDEKQAGGYDLDDNRIRFGLIATDAVVNENAAENTHLTETDIERLDTLWWRAMKNQTLTRSKYGQEPEIYLRVEYEQDNFHIGGLSKYLNIDEELSTEIAKVRATQDLTLDLGNLLQKLDEYSGRIDTIHFNISPRIKMSVNGNKHSLAELKDLLTDTFGQDTTHEISIWDERDNTLPN
jgi:CRISPR-associated protein Csh2